MNDSEETFNNLWLTLGELPMTDEEAIRVVKKLYRFAGGNAGDVEVSRRQRAGVTRDGSGFFFVNPNAGWKQVVAGVTLYICADKYVSGNWGSVVHYKEAVKLTREVIKRQWLDGRLQDQPEPKPEKKVIVVRKLVGVITLQKKWEAKKKRAENALKKLKIKRRYYEKEIDKCGR